VEATRSVEADIVFLDDPDAGKADEVERAIGEESEFHRTHGYYGLGVTLATAVLPAGWQDRVVRFPREDAAPSSASCLEIYDLSTAKLVAGREKDFEYVTALIVADLVDVEVLRQRCELVPGLRRCGPGSSSGSSGSGPETATTIGTDDTLSPGHLTLLSTRAEAEFCSRVSAAVVT
jgi:hypothetical protein